MNYVLSNQELQTAITASVMLSRKSTSAKSSTRKQDLDNHLRSLLEIQLDRAQLIGFDSEEDVA